MLPTRRQALGALGSGLFASAAYGQKNSPDAVAGIPVNYEEARVGTYTLPDPLTLNNGKRVGDATGYRPDAGGRAADLAHARLFYALRRTRDHSVRLGCVSKVSPDAFAAGRLKKPLALQESFLPEGGVSAARAVLRRETRYQATQATIVPATMTMSMSL